MPEPQVRIFVSSPSDLEHERALVKDIIEQLAQEYLPYFKLQAVLWEEEALTAAQSFQAGLLRPSECEIVLVMLWTRLGTPLAEDPYGGMTGTEWEFVDAVEASASQGTPEVLVYQKNAPRLVDINDAEAIRTATADRERLETFFKRHFFNPDGSFRRAFRQFDKDSSFRDLVENQLRKLLNRRISTERRFAAGTEDWLGSPFRALAPYDIGDDRIFTGRETETRELVSRLDRLVESPTGLLLLTGPSGVGKSSLIRSGLLPHLLRPFLFSNVSGCRWCLVEPAPKDPVLDLARKLTAPGVLGAALEDLGLDAERLARTLATAPSVGIDQIGAALERGARLDRHTEERPGRTQLAILLDPLDACLRPEDMDSAERRCFIAIVAALARQEGVWVIAALSSHMLPALAEVPELNALVTEESWLRIEPPAHARIRQVMEIPARVAGLQYEEAGRGPKGSLIETLESEAGQLRDWPMLLEPALEDLYRRATARDEPGTRHGRLLRFDDYRETGGIAGAMVRRADALWDELDADTRAALPRLCRALLALEGGPRSRPTARTGDLATLERDPDCRALIRTLAERRLLVLESIPDPASQTSPPASEHGFIAYLGHALRQTTDEWMAKRRLRTSGEGLDRLIREEAATDAIEGSDPGRVWEDYRPVARIAHPALIERWRPIRDWAAQEDNRRDLNLRYQIGRQAALWKRTDFNQEYLLGELGHAAARLFVENHAAELDPLERDYLDHSWAHLRLQRRRNRWTIGSAVAALALFAGIALYALWDASLQSKLNLHRGHLQEAELAIERGDTPTAVRLALAAGPYLPREATDALGHALSANRLVAMRTPAAPAPDGWIAPVFAPDGERLVTGSKDTGIQLWVREDQRFERQADLAGPGHGIERILFGAPEGAQPTILGVGPEGIWRLPLEPNQPPDWSCGTGPDAPLAMDRNGRYLALVAKARSRDARLCLVDLQRPGEPLWQSGEDASSILSLDFAPDGRRLVTAEWTGVARIMDTTSGTERLRLPRQGDIGRASIRAVFDTEGSRVAVAYYDERVRIYDAQGQEIHELGTVRRGKRLVRIHQSAVRDLAFTPDGFRLMAGDSSGQLVRWDLRSGTAEVMGQQDLGIEQIAVTPEVDPVVGENLVLSRSQDGIARLWSLETSRQIATFSHAEAISEARFSRDGRRIMTSSAKGGSARLWTVAPNNRLAFHLDQEDHVRYLTMSESGPDRDQLLLATADYDGRVELWRYDRSDEIKPPVRQLSRIAHQGRVRHVAISPSNHYLASAGADGYARVWDLANGKDCALNAASRPGDCPKAGAPECPDVYRVLFAPDERWVMTASSDPSQPLRLWNPGSCAPLPLPRALTQFEGGIRALDLHSDSDGRGTRLATGSREGVLQVMAQDAEGEWSRLCRLAPHTAGVNEVRLSPDGAWLAASSWDDRATLVEITESGCGEPIALEPGAGTLYDVQFSPDGQRLVTASFEGKAHLWSLDGTLIAELSGHGNRLSTARFSPDGRWILTASRDGTLRIWKTPTGVERATYQPFLTLEADLGAIRHAAFSPSGNEIAAGYWDNTALLWRLWSHDAAPDARLKRIWGPDRARLALIQEAMRFAAEHAPSTARGN
ncbi:nSTAND1 domain-containing NTPase [Imhoffiella purpurea]|uniref:Novel STAND NTPase 1 domain-containing protein n=1 Tax=Imhoffiella purpurea TaxID=1249627 RepID=W9W3P0_9GAMM|nr:AAA family ATPase [Imhoffiella purpurea]EXJ17180.1 hypothetical protein D779_0007 [Imhoffiella purpurea]